MKLEDKIKAHAKQQADEIASVDQFKAAREAYNEQTEQLVEVVVAAGVSKEAVTSLKWHETTVFPLCKFDLLGVPCSVSKNGSEISIYVASTAAAVLLLDSGDSEREFNKANLERVLIESVARYVEVTPPATEAEPKQSKKTDA